MCSKNCFSSSGKFQPIIEDGAKLCFISLNLYKLSLGFSIVGFGVLAVSDCEMFEFNSLL
jgi:hypothetical protein